MSLFRRLFYCSQGSHRPDPDRDVQMRRPGDQSPVRYSKCLDCGHVIAKVSPFGDDPWRVITNILPLLPLDHYETMRRLGIVGLLPPEPWPHHPGGAHTGKRPANPDAKPPKTRGSLGGFHGGPIPGLGDTPDLSDPKTVEVLQEMLPRGVEPPLASVKVDVKFREGAFEPIAPLEPPAFDGSAYAKAVATAARGAEELLAAKADRHLLKDHVYGAIAETIAMLGTCCRLKVGCVLLTKEGRVAGLGYNGAGPGMDHCHEDHCNETCRCLRTLHAEQNALYSRNGDPVVAYVTNEPCLNCTKELALAGVRRVVYLKPYTSIAEAERTARQEWIDHYRITWEALNDPSSPA